MTSSKLEPVVQIRKAIQGVRLVGTGWGERGGGENGAVDDDDALVVWLIVHSSSSSKGRISFSGFAGGEWSCGRGRRRDRVERKGPATSGKIVEFSSNSSNAF